MSFRRANRTILPIRGLDNAGKSTILAKLFNEPLNEVPPTAGFMIKSRAHSWTIGSEINKVAVDYWDIGGQTSLRRFWHNVYHKCHGLIWVIDSCDSERLQLCRQVLQTTIVDTALKNVSILILCNKQDLPNAKDVATLTEIIDLSALECRGNPVVIRPCSAVESSSADVEIILNEFLTICVERHPAPLCRSLADNLDANVLSTTMDAHKCSFDFVKWKPEETQTAQEFARLKSLVINFSGAT